MKTAAIYARVSSDEQKEENAIASQTAALTPGLERVRDLAAEGQLDAVLVYAPDRLSRRQETASYGG